MLTLKKRTRSRSCSARDSFWTSLNQNSALATRAYHCCTGRTIELQSEHHFQLETWWLRRAFMRVSCKRKALARDTISRDR